MEEQSKICLIAPTESLAVRARGIIRKQGLSIQVHTAVLEEAVKLARELMENGTWMFISRGVTRDMLEKELHTTVVNIPVVASDYIPAIQKIKNVTGFVAFFALEPPNDQLKTMCYLLHIQMRHYQFSDLEMCKDCVRRAVADGAVWGVGGGVSGRYAEEMGLPYTVVESSDNSIEQAIESACQLQLLHQKDAEKRAKVRFQMEQYRNILNYTHDGIVAVDEKGIVVVANRVAEQMLDPAKAPFEGKYVENILPNTKLLDVLRSGKEEINHLMNIHNTVVSTNRVPIVVDGKIQGAVATFQNVQAIQSAERSIRINLHKKGMVSKYNFSDIIGVSPALEQAKEMASVFSDSQSTVMLYGETGTGKEMFAQSIHNASAKKDGPFVAVNCMSLPKNLLESELFGYVDGSFTGAKKGGKAGLFEMAHGGTIFLDEIGELPMEFQAQFLRVLQEKEVRRIGGDTVIPIDTRVIGATNRDLLEQVKNGKFREDLYYRLNVLTVEIPPLREREDDFLLIADLIQQRLIPGRDEAQKKLLWRIMERCRGYSWPGNVRQLNNAVELVTLFQRHGLKEEEIFSALKCSLRLGEGEKEREAAVISDSLKKRELRYIKEVLDKNQGNISQTARELHMSRSTLYRKLKEP